MKNSSSIGSSRQGIEKLEKFGVEPGESQKQERGDRWGKDEGRKSSFRLTDGHVIWKMLNWRPRTKNIKGRVVLRGDIVKDNSGSYAVFTEQGSSASQMTAAKVMHIISRLLGCAGQAADAASAYTQVKMENAPIIIEISKIWVSRQLVSSTTTRKAWIMVKYGRFSRSSWAKSVRSKFDRIGMREGNLKIPF